MDEIKELSVDEQLRQWEESDNIIVSINIGRHEVFGLFYDRYGLAHSVPVQKSVKDFIRQIQLQLKS